jgi:hypothetical protein
VEDLARAIDQVAASDARALLVTGTGEKAFCAGADIAELAGRTLAQTKRGAELGQAVMAKIERLPMPSVAIVNGYAFGGGLELALACTFRLVTPNAKLGLPEIKLGLIPGYGGTQRLPRAVGEARALEMILTAKALDAQTALAWSPAASWRAMPLPRASLSRASSPATACPRWDLRARRCSARSTRRCTRACGSRPTSRRSRSRPRTRPRAWPPSSPSASPRSRTAEMAGKVIAVTGASRGIGAAIAAELVRRGFHRGLPHPRRQWSMAVPARSPACSPAT